MHVYIWMEDTVTDRSKLLQVSHLQASIFLLGHWFEANKSEVIASNDVWVKAAKIQRPSQPSVRVMSVLDVVHLSASNFIHLWNWSSTVYVNLYLAAGSYVTGDFAIDVYDNGVNPYEGYLGTVQSINFTACYEALREDFRAAVSLLGNAVTAIHDPDGKISVESLLEREST
jgi:hypothetical protein